MDGRIDKWMKDELTVKVNIKVNGSRDVQGIEAPGSDECSQSLWHVRTIADLRNNLCTGEERT